jgi:DNA polymerase (family 10)
MKNRTIAGLFNEIADILELRGENVFRINAYRRAAETIESLARAIEDVAAEDALSDLPGIGKDLASKIQEYLGRGEIEYLNELRAQTPAILLEMLRIPGVGPKTAVRLHEELGISSLDELRHAALDHRIQTLPKMKSKTEENILKGLEFLSRSGGRTPIGTALPLARGLIAHLEKLPEVKRIAAAGSLRRFRETVGDIDILCASRSPDKVIAAFAHYEDVVRILAEGSTKGSVVLRDGIQADLRVVEEASFGAALNYFTGSKEHNIRLREIAIKRGLKLNEYGVFNEAAAKGARGKGAAAKKRSRARGAHGKDSASAAGTGEIRIAGKTEQEVYKALGLPYIPPEIREDTGEIEAARSGKLPALVELGDIRGDLHCHSNYSDGAARLEEIASAARKRGYSYMLITDHSQGLHVANGLSPARLRRQLDEIDRLNEKMKAFRLLKGSEIDILPDGSLDMREDLLERLDIAYVAIHSNFKMKRDQMTRRVITAMEHPHANILAHPTGRILGARDAYEIDMAAVIEAAAGTGTAIEINAHPARLDLDAGNCRLAAEAGVMIAIGTDTHVLTELDYMLYGIGTARRGWLTKHNILNTRTAKQLMSILRKKPPRK